ncbi:MAG: hypothetical protein AAF664_12540 [Planctomycetota bacterium]
MKPEPSPLRRVFLIMGGLGLLLASGAYFLALPMFLGPIAILIISAIFFVFAYGV